MAIILKLKKFKKVFEKIASFVWKKALNCNKNSVFNEFLIDLNQSSLYLNKTFFEKMIFLNVNRD
jgi:hypothetical protein